MKKTIKISLLFGLALLVCALLFTACDMGEEPQSEHVHAFEEWQTTKEPTCAQDGEKARYCSCGEKQTETVAALSHTEVVDAAVEPTCTETGLSEGMHCSACNKVLIDQQVLDALGHTEVIDAEIEATCTEAGLSEGKHCSTCNEVLVAQQTVAALGHTEVVDKAQAPTCTQTGLSEGKHCSTCNEVLIAQQTVAALGHTEVIDAAVAPTCTESGLTEGKHCSVCDTVIVTQQSVSATGHKFGEWVTTEEPGCKTVGKKERYCACGVKETQDIAATGHKWQEATCTEPKTCSSCNETYGVALGHTCKIGTCERCGWSNEPTIEIPSTPMELEFGVVSFTKLVYSKVQLTEIKYEFNQYNVLLFTFVGEKTYDWNGSTATQNIMFDWKLLDSDGIVICSGALQKSGLMVGDKFKLELNIYSNQLPEDGTSYTLVLSDKQI